MSLYRIYLCQFNALLGRRRGVDTGNRPRPARRGIEADIVAQPGSELLAPGQAGRSSRRRHPHPLRRRALDPGQAAPGTSAARGTTAIWANLTKDLKAAAVAGRLAGRPDHSRAPGKATSPSRTSSTTAGISIGWPPGCWSIPGPPARTVLASAPWLRPDRVHLLYKGIDTERFQPAAAAPAAPVVGFRRPADRAQGPAGTHGRLGRSSTRPTDADSPGSAPGRRRAPRGRDPGLARTP